jgi:hypothetical protein
MCEADGMGNGPFDFSWTRNFLILGRWWILNLHPKKLVGNSTAAADIFI